MKRLEFGGQRPPARKAFCVGCNCVIDGVTSIYCGICASKSRGSKGGDSLIRGPSMGSILLALDGPAAKSGPVRGAPIPLHTPLMPPGPHRAHIDFLFRFHRRLLTAQQQRWHRAHIAQKPRRSRPRPPQRPPGQRPTHQGPFLGASA
jgi:hypothetical protein